jgi:NAD(P)-dependent dehydrogenase (short-subunit alcohol dehydrogenase family)
MGDPESIEALAKRLRARNQRLDALVNNAGVYQGPVRRIWDVNVLGRCCSPVCWSRSSPGVHAW